MAGSLGLLYDRVILPIADWATGTRVGADLHKHCPILQQVVSRTKRLREGRRPLCRPLSARDAAEPLEGAALALSLERAVEAKGLSWQALCERGDLGEAFGVIHSVVAAKLKTTSSGRQRPFVVYVPDPRYGETLADQIAQLLDAELRAFAIASIDVAVDKLDSCRYDLRDSSSRLQYAHHLMNFSSLTAARVKDCSTPQERRRELVQSLVELKASYDAFIHDVRTLERAGLLTIRDGANNIIHAIRGNIDLKRLTFGGRSQCMFEFDLDEGCKRFTSQLLADKVKSVVGQVAWHHDLFAYSVSIDDAFKGYSKL